MTAKEFMDLPEDPNKTRYELVRGEVVVSPSPSPDHGYVDTKLRSILDGYVTAQELGEIYGDIDTPFSSEDVRRPDLMFFSNARLHLIAEGRIEGPPDLCIEILSPSNARLDRIDKFNLYQHANVPHYWIVDPMERTIEAYSFVGGTYVDAGRGQENDVVYLPPFKGLPIELSKLWRPKRP
jgi:Uma2 family endonuclease